VRILVVTIEPPDPFGNPASRWFYVLFKGLVERGHDVTMLSTCSDLGSRGRAEELFPRPRYDLRCFDIGVHSGVRGKLRSAWQPYSYVFSPEFRSALEAQCQAGYDVLHLEHLWSGWLAWDRVERTLVNVHYLFRADFADSTAGGAYDRLRRMATYAAESRILNHFPHVATLTERLARDIREIAPKRSPHILPLGIDASLYPFSAVDPDGPPTIGIVGNYAWTPTYRAAVRLKSELWPRIKAAVPSAKLLIVGRSAVAQLGPSEDPDVEIIENVPDIIPYFKRLHVLLNPPPHGSGTKVKIQESMALGVPVVTNTDGGEGIPGKDGEHWGFADDDAGLVERAVALLNDPELRRSRRIAARALIETEFGSQRTLGAVFDAYAAMTVQPTGRSA
jgi:polysaccharide biosynthesis protein PslH